MKHILLITTFLLLTFSCKAQSVLILGDPPVDKQNLSKPIFMKDLNGLRNNFYGVWHGTSVNSELTLYIYKVDDVPGYGLSLLQGDIYGDRLFGYYIYKENGIEITNCISEANINQDPIKIKHSPFFGITGNEESIEFRFKDYGIQIQNPENGSFFAKRARASFNITNLNSGNTLEANFELKNIQGAGQRVITGNTPIQPYNYSFSMPTNFTLTKIANTPPPLN